MKRYSSLITLGVAVLCGIAAVMLFSRMQTHRAPTQAAIISETMPVTEIVVAARDLAIGTRLTPDCLSLARWPKASVPAGAFEQVKNLEGRVAVSRLITGEPVLAAELAAPGSGAGLVALIPQGMRAMSIRVDEVVGVSGFVLPNTYVDVIGVEKKDDSATAKTILEKILVLAIAQETFTEEGKAKVVKTVTLQMKPEETEKLALQTHKGAIQLVLRNPLDAKRPEPQPGHVGAKAPAVHKASPFAVEVIRASKRESISFKNNQSEEIM